MPLTSITDDMIRSEVERLAPGASLTIKEHNGVYSADIHSSKTNRGVDISYNHAALQMPLPAFSALYLAPPIGMVFSV